MLKKYHPIELSSKQARANKEKVTEITNYVSKILIYEDEFEKKSTLSKNSKFKKPDKIKGFPKGGHWITKDGRHILIED